MNVNIVHSWTVHWLHLVFVPVVFLQFNFCLLVFMNSWHKFYSKFSKRAINSYPAQPFTQIIYQFNFFFLENTLSRAHPLPAPTRTACTHFNFHVVIRCAFHGQLRLSSLSWILTNFFLIWDLFLRFFRKVIMEVNSLNLCISENCIPPSLFVKADVGNHNHTDIKDTDQLFSDSLGCCWVSVTIQISH